MVRLTFLHSNDIHGRLDALARLTTVAREQQRQVEEQGRAVFRWDAGDAFDRRFEACRLTRGAALAPVLTASGVTLQALGNDICYPYGLKATANMAARAGYPVLAANLQRPDGSLPTGLTRSVLLDAPGGVRVGVFGMTDPFGDLYSVYGLITPDAEQIAADLVSELRAEGAEVVVFLSHLGLNGDRAVAAAVPGIDLILGGHSHDLLPEGERVGSTLIAQAGQWAEYLGRVDLDRDAESGRWTATASVMPIPEDTVPDPQVVAAIDELEREVAALIAEPVGELVADLTLDYFGACGTANLAAWALRRWADAEIGLASGGVAHTGLSAGVVTRGQLANAFPVSSNPQVSLVTGAALVRALERSLDPAVAGFVHGGLRGSPIGVLGLSGMQVEVQLGGAMGERVRAVQVNGEALDPLRVYRVGHSDVETFDLGAPGGAVLQGEGVEQQVYDLSLLLEDVVRAALKETTPEQRDLPLAWRGIEGFPDLREAALNHDTAN